MTTLASHISPSIAGFDLETPGGWVAACCALLADKPDWTAIRDKSGQGYLVTVAGDVYAAPLLGDPASAYTEDDLLELDFDRWSDILGCWEGSNADACAATLLQPEFLILAHA